MFLALIGTCHYRSDVITNAGPINVLPSPAFRSVSSLVRVRTLRRPGLGKIMRGPCRTIPSFTDNSFLMLQNGVTFFS